MNLCLPGEGKGAGGQQGRGGHTRGIRAESENTPEAYLQAPAFPVSGPQRGLGSRDKPWSSFHKASVPGRQAPLGCRPPSGPVTPGYLRAPVSLGLLIGTQTSRLLGLTGIIVKRFLV